MTGVWLQVLEAGGAKMLPRGKPTITDCKSALQYTIQSGETGRDCLPQVGLKYHKISGQSWPLSRQSQYLLNQKKSQPALQHLDIALSMNQHSSDILIARTRCLIAEGQWQEALRSAETILEMEDTNLQAILVKAEALYNTSQFEYALLNFHRGQVPGSD